MGANDTKAMLEVLNRVHDYLGELIRDNLVEDAPRASDLADDVYDAIHGSHSTTENHQQSGNTAVLHDALLIVKKLFDGQIMFQPAIREAHEAVNAALAAPPRNCDVGTADEQEERFKHYCGQHYSACDVDAECFRCPLASEKTSCEFAWAQMPYEERGDHA